MRGLVKEWFLGGSVIAGTRATRIDPTRIFINRFLDRLVLLELIVRCVLIQPNPSVADAKKGCFGRLWEAGGVGEPSDVEVELAKSKWGESGCPEGEEKHHLEAGDSI